LWQVKNRLENVTVHYINVTVTVHGLAQDWEKVQW